MRIFSFAFEEVEYQTVSPGVASRHCTGVGAMGVNSSPFGVTTSAKKNAYIVLVKWQIVAVAQIS